jgi:predicted O-methyltransferase YrrM
VNSTLRRLLKTATPSPIRREARALPGKIRMVRFYRGLRNAPVASVRYLLLDREESNFTYRVANIDELAAFMGEFLGVDPAVCRGYIDELEGDRNVEVALSRLLKDRPDRNRSMPFGRRLGWYCAARVLRPAQVVETGIHDGLGSVALLMALRRNTDEGSPGSLISIDIEPDSGWLIPDDLRSLHTVWIGDSIPLLRDDVSAPVGLFVHDSDHRYEHEAAEFRAIEPHLAAGGMLISDNAHATTALKDFSSERGYRFGFWRERPQAHFYPGAGIGIAVKSPLS